MGSLALPESNVIEVAPQKMQHKISQISQKANSACVRLRTDAKNMSE